MTIVEEDSGDTVKVHYVGYSSNHDEWKNQEEVETVNDIDETETVDYHATAYQPFSLYSLNLLIIKQSMSCGQKASPLVNITIQFDLIQFNGGIECAGVPCRMVKGVQHYKINHYKTWTHFLELELRRPQHGWQLQLC